VGIDGGLLVNHVLNFIASSGTTPRLEVLGNHVLSAR